MTRHAHTEDLDHYMLALGRVNPLSKEEERELALKYRDKGDRDAFEKLVQSNLRFVVKVAHQFSGYGYPLEDLVQEGNLGLIRGVEKFDPDRDYRLITYAVWWIRAHIQSYVMRSWSMVKVGTTQAERKMFFRVRSLRNKFEFDQSVKDDEVMGLVADELGLDPGLVKDFELRLAARDFSLHAKRPNDSEPIQLDLEDHSPNPEEHCADSEWRTFLMRYLESKSSDMDEREKFILGHRLLSLDPKSLKEVGRHFKISPERVRQLEQRLLSRLRDGLHAADFPVSRRAQHYSH
ncbi:MAG: RNA polymerase factor sigma-32 [Myxococcota bacterium]|nr:RNA polymerase factor sigma-32 [Myxococcota bacterium]